MKKPETIKKNNKFEPTLLDEWMKKRGISTYALGRVVGIDKSCIQVWRTGSGVPSLVAAFRLEEITKGEVPAVSWLATTVGQSAYALMKERAHGS